MSRFKHSAYLPRHLASLELSLRPDMRADLKACGFRLPNGPKWSLLCGDRVLCIGGLEPSGASTSLGWFLSADLTTREWAAVCGVSRDCIDWARRHAIRRIHALTPGDQPKAAAMLMRLGFKLTGQEGDDAVMTLELI